MEMTDEYFMRQALKEANKALDADEVPIGAVIVLNEKIIARGYNQVETLNDSTAHAEMIVLTSAFNFLGAKYLPEATLYVTIEPCSMCCGALYWSKIGKLVYGAADPRHGGLLSRNASGKNPLHPKTKIVENVLANDCGNLIKNFFEKKRYLSGKMKS
jgi:tRNA(adenine34) deaminase